LFFAFTIAQDCSAALSTCISDYAKCYSAVFSTVPISGAALCDCSQKLSDCTGRCDGTSVLISSQCGAYSAIESVSNFNFGTCSVCNPVPPSDLWPSACSACSAKFAKCVVSGVSSFDYSKPIEYTLALNCKCIGEFVGCFKDCDSPLSGSTGAYCAATQNVCACDGSTAVKGTPKQLVDFIYGLGNSQFVAYIKKFSGIASITLKAKGTAIDRFALDIDVSATLDLPKLSKYISDYLGTEVTILPGDTSLSKRGTELVSSNQVVTTYTVQVTANHIDVSAGSIMVSLFVTVFAIALSLM